jgi:hypothetical protein
VEETEMEAREQTIYIPQPMVETMRVFSTMGIHFGKK